jgi:hypothetical protein
MPTHPDAPSRNSVPPPGPVQLDQILAQLAAQHADELRRARQEGRRDGLRSLWTPAQVYALIWLAGMLAISVIFALSAF